MRPIIQLALLLLAIVALPWIATNPPDWSAFPDSGWVQAIGSIAAIFVGFGYVALQNHWTRKEKLADERQLRQHVISLCETIASEMRKRIKTFDEACKEGNGIDDILGRDALDIIGDELLSISPRDCGSALFSTDARQAGLFAKSFAHLCETAARNDPIKAPDVEMMRSHSRFFSQAHKRLEQLD